MKRTGLLCFAVVSALELCVTMAYEKPTHKNLSASAAVRSVLTDYSKLRDIGLLLPINSQKFPNSKGVPKTVSDLIQDGAKFEDNFPRSVNHFFNPINNQPLSGVPLNHTSPDWEIEDAGDIAGQVYSYKDARQYFYEALTTIDNSARAVAWGKTFETLGHVVHHIQDMAQPQHVRNDAHLDTEDLLNGVQLGKTPSLYEKYTDKNKGSVMAKAGLALYPVPTSDFYNTPRTFWINFRDDGLAQFTNENFVSAGTNFTSAFALPAFDPASKLETDIQTLCASANPPCENPNLTGKITFYGNPVHDKYTGQTTFNAYATTESVFNAALTTYTPSYTKIFTLNRFNFDMAQAYLIPRAVAYSAGLINYFFRGKMEISLPNEGVYGIVDHATEHQIDVGGFHTIKLKLKNVTPIGITTEPMTNGTLTAVLKFHRNTCYKDDLTGEPPLVNPVACRNGVEDIVVSNTIPNVSLTGTTQPFTSPHIRHAVSFTRKA